MFSVRCIRLHDVIDNIGQIGTTERKDGVKRRQIARPNPPVNSLVHSVHRLGRHSFSIATSDAGHNEVEMGAKLPQKCIIFCKVSVKMVCYVGLLQKHYTHSIS